MSESPPRAHAIVLAGGRGTRFWPRSRTQAPKQLLNIVGDKTMLQQTAARLTSAFPVSRVWVVTNREQAAIVRRQLPRLPASHVLAEPVGRNTAAAIGLAAVHLLHQSGDALMAVLPADHYIAQPALYLRIVRAALRVASQPGNMVVLGIPPTRPETGYGYIERTARRPVRIGGYPAYAVRRFIEKPSLERAQRFAASGRFYWNAGMFFWRVSTFLESLSKFLPATYRALMAFADDVGTRRYPNALRRVYPRLENISVDYAILEPATQQKSASHVFVLPARVGWSDIGSWAAVYELLASRPDENVSGGPCVALDAQGNFLWAPKKFVAAIGVRDLVVVDTPDALLICPRDRAQDVSRAVKWLEQRRLARLL